MVVVPSVLEAVTVHPEGALCTRLASVQPVEGRLPTQVRLEGLPLSLLPGSLRASVLQGPQGLVVRDVRCAYQVHLPPEPDVPAAQRALEEAEEALSALSAERQRVEREVQSLQGLTPAFPPREPDQPPREASPQAVLALADLLDSELSTLYAQRLELERRQQQAAEQVVLCRHRLEECSSAVRGQRALLHRAALLTLSSLEGGGEALGEVRLSLEYAVQGAAWVPGYELLLPTSMSGGTLRMRASVVQRTGEDWRGVRLALSTAQLHRRTEVPELKALRIGRRQPPPARSGWREPPPGLDELFAGFDAAGGLRAPRAPAPSQPARPPPKRRRSITGEVPVASLSPPPPPSIPPLVSPGAPPPPMAAPMPMPAAPAAAAMSASLSRAAAMPPMQRARRVAAPQVAARSAGASMPPPMDEDEEELLEQAFGGAGAAPAEPPEPPRLELAQVLLNYERLELAAASLPGARGRLQPQPEHASPELQALLAVHVQVDVLALVARQEHSAASVHELAPPSGTVPLRQSAPHFAYRFDVAPRAEVPSDGAWHTVPVFSAEVGTSPEYVCVPSLQPHAFRTVRVENRTPHVLLAGPVDVTLGDEFLLTSSLPTLVPGGTQVLGLGVEEGLKVARNTRFEEASGGVFGGASLLTHRVSVELANRLPHPVTVEVRERLPAVPPSERDIKVEEVEVEPPWLKRTPPVGEVPVEGERAWRVTLQPGEAQALEAKWVVKIPSSKVLEGGNRRT